MKFNIEKLTYIDNCLEQQLLFVWEQSVRKTHDFLLANDIGIIRDQVKISVHEMDTLIGVRDKFQTLNAFMGVKGNKLEMLFIAPDFIGMGIGKYLVNYALEILDVKYVDVNLENKNAIGFYEHLGFRAYNTAFDKFGNPYPIVHMKLER